MKKSMLTPISTAVITAFTAGLLYFMPPQRVYAQEALPQFKVQKYDFETNQVSETYLPGLVIDGEFPHNASGIGANGKDKLIGLISDDNKTVLYSTGIDDVCDDKWREISGNGATPYKPIIIHIPSGKDTQYANSIGVVVQGMDNQVWHNNYLFNNGDWNGWISLPGATIKDGKIFSYIGSAWDVLGLGTDNNVKHNINWLSDWTGWVDKGPDNGIPWFNPTSTIDAQGRTWYASRGADIGQLADAIFYKCALLPRADIHEVVKQLIGANPADAVGVTHPEGVELIVRDGATEYHRILVNSSEPTNTSKWQYKDKITQQLTNSL